MDYDPRALRAGSHIAGYRIVGILGAGGFGITYEALSAVTNRRYAIKEFFPLGRASREDATKVVYSTRDANVVSWALDRFERSTTELCQLKHPNIVEVFHYVKENNTGYMIMEYVEGTTFEGWLAKRGAALDPAGLRPLIEPILGALDYVHARGRIHRDIAADNIMIRPDGQPVLIDFGAIKAIEQRTRVAGISYAVAKAGYSPPEQTQEGVELDRSADVYAIGAVLYRGLTGRAPVDAERRKHDVAMAGADSYVSIAKAAAGLPPGTAATIDRALALRPKDRPQTIGELKTGLGWDPAVEPTRLVPVAPARDAVRTELLAKLAAGEAQLTRAQERIQALERLVEARAPQEIAPQARPSPRARLLAGALSLAAIVVAWEICALIVASPFLLPGPGAALAALDQFLASAEAGQDVVSTLSATAIGWIIGTAAAALLLAIPAGRRLAATLRLHPSVVFLFALSVTPLPTLWLGLGVQSHATNVFIGVMLYRLALGSRMPTSRETRPGSILASLTSDLDTTFPIGLSLCLVAEWFSDAPPGLGFAMETAARNFAISRLLGLTILTVAFGGGVAGALAFLTSGRTGHARHLSSAQQRERGPQPARSIDPETALRRRRVIGRIMLGFIVAGVPVLLILAGLI